MWAKQWWVIPGDVLDANDERHDGTVLVRAACAASAVARVRDALATGERAVWRDAANAARPAASNADAYCVTAPCECGTADCRDGLHDPAVTLAVIYPRGARGYTRRNDALMSLPRGARPWAELDAGDAAGAATTVPAPRWVS